MGIEYFKKILSIKDSTINLKIWDTAGQEQFRCLTRNFYKNSSGVIVVYDVSNKDSFDKVKFWIDRVKENADEKIKMILIGNKIDKKKMISPEEIKMITKEYHINYFETSAKESIGITEAIDYLIDEILKENQEEKLTSSSTENYFSLSTRDSEKEYKMKCMC